MKGFPGSLPMAALTWTHCNLSNCQNTMELLKTTEISNTWTLNLPIYTFTYRSPNSWFKFQYLDLDRWSSSEHCCPQKLQFTELGKTAYKCQWQPNIRNMWSRYIRFEDSPENRNWKRFHLKTLWTETHTPVAVHHIVHMEFSSTNYAAITS